MSAEDRLAPPSDTARSAEPMDTNTIELAAAIERAAADASFSGVIRIERRGEVLIDRAYGLADRAHEVANTTETRFAIASAVKGLTALTVMSLVEDGTLALATRARELLGSDLDLVDERVTVEHLLSHRSGIGDYLDEDGDHAIDDYVMPIPVHQLVTTDDYLDVLDGHRSKFDPGSGFSYCNGGYVLLALLAERAAGSPFHELVQRHVCDHADMRHTEFLRTDELPGNTAVGYLWPSGLRTNALHLPVRGSGDGGIYSTLDDVHRMWDAFRTGRLVTAKSVALMTTPSSGETSAGTTYGLGFWLRPARHSRHLEGYDAGVSFRSVDQPALQITHTVISNTSDGAWPITELIEQHLGT